MTQSPGLSPEFRERLREATAHLNKRFMAYRESMLRTAEAFANLRAKPGSLREAMSKSRHQHQIAMERAKGLAYVRAEAARVRSELGLPPDTNHTKGN